MKKIFFAFLSLILILAMTLSACGVVEPEKPSVEPQGSKLPTEIPNGLGEPSLMLHYFRVNPVDYDKWGFWIWQTGGEGAVYALNYQDDFGGVALYPLSAFGSEVLDKGLGIIPRLQSAWTKDGDADRMLKLEGLTPDSNGCYHIYIIEGDMTLYTELSEELSRKIGELGYGLKASFQSEKEIKLTAAKPMKWVDIVCGDKKLGQVDAGGETSFVYSMGAQADLNLGYSAEVTFSDGKTMNAEVSIMSLYSTLSFNDMFYYDGELGAIYSRQATTFRVWSPVSNRITLNLYNSGHAEETPVSMDMAKADKGVFELTVNDDLSGRYYTYTVYNSTYPDGREIVDPYARSAGLSGIRGQVVNFEDTNPSGWDKCQPIDYDRRGLTVWETHVSDVTSSDTWTGKEANRYKFLGVIEKGTRYSENGVTVTTGFDHIKELGVNAVQLIPIFDQANDETRQVFNWGYNPLNYNVLEGSYSSNPEDGYVRIREFKQLVKAFNEAGINVIMDVVYNHVNAAAGSNFDVLMPGYYFRYTSSGALSNGSGCGNELASERSMVSKFIVDSVCFWAKEYKLGGFRFDLMGLHDITTMNIAAAELKKINPSITVYGEPWTGGTTTLSSEHQAVQKNANSFEGYGQFNDQMRDALIKGGLNAVSSTGWVTNSASVSSGDVNKILAGLMGITEGSGYKISDPNKTVNYVTCHDNYTLYDRIRLAGAPDKETIKRMAVLANSVVLTSNGTTFMLAGEEFLRSKGTSSSAGNSYNASYRVNELDYSRKIQYADVFKAYKALIAFKQQTEALHLGQEEMSRYRVNALNDGAVIEISFAEGDREYKIYHANGVVKDFSADLSGYTLVLDTLGLNEALTENTALSPYQTIICFKK